MRWGRLGGGGGKVLGWVEMGWDCLLRLSSAELLCVSTAAVEFPRGLQVEMSLGFVHRSLVGGGDSCG